MQNLIGDEVVLVQGLDNLGRPSGEQFPTTTQDIADLSGGSVGGLRNVSSGTTDTSSPSDGLIQWVSSTNGAKTENVGQGTKSGQTLQVCDGRGNAATYPITLVGQNCTIGGGNSLALSDNFFNIVLTWDGLANWIITGYYNGSKSVAPPSYLLTESGEILETESGQYLTL